MELHSIASPPLPRRDEAVRCAEAEAGRRCVLPPEHPGEHVYPRLPED
jgi:hypothetical protein